MFAINSLVDILPPVAVHVHVCTARHLVYIDKYGCVCVCLQASVSLRPDNVKTLKKQNQDLQDKFEEGKRDVCVCV